MKLSLALSATLAFLMGITISSFAQENSDQTSGTVITSIAGATESGKISLDQLKAMKEVQSVLIDDNAKTKLEVISFEVRSKVRGNKVKAACRGSKLSSDAKRIMDNVMEGETVTFDYIKVKDPDSPGVVRASPPIEFELF